MCSTTTPESPISTTNPSLSSSSQWKFDEPPYCPPRILFFGGDRVSVAALDALRQRLSTLLKDGDSVSKYLYVVYPYTSNSSSEKLSPVGAYCRRYGLPYTMIDHPKSMIKSSFSIEGIFKEVRERCKVGGMNSEPTTTTCPFDVVVVASFRYFIPDSLLLNLPPVINMHPSLLPKYRGASPIFSTLLNGESKGGVTLIKLVPNEKMDSGDIVGRAELDIPPTMDIRQYFPAVLSLGCSLLVDTLLPAAPLPLQSNWGAHFDRVWSSGSVQGNKVHFKEDPFHAPLLHHGRCTPLEFDNISGDAAYNRWRAFVGGEYFGEVSSILDKGRTPPRDQLLGRALSKYGRRHNRQVTSLDEIPEAERASFLHTPITFKIAVPKSQVGDHVLGLLDKIEEERLEVQVDNSCGSTDFNRALNSSPGHHIPPGSAVFTACSKDHPICAIKCARGGWFYWSHATLEHRHKHISAYQLQTSFALPKEKLIIGLFTK